MVELDETQILQAGLEDVYEYLNMLSFDEHLSKTEKAILKDAKSKVKDGITTKFNALFVFIDNIDEDEKNQVVTIPNCRTGKVVSIESFVEELEDRKAFGKKVLLDLSQEDGFFRGNQE